MLTLIGRFPSDANLYDPPPPRTRRRKGGRPRKKGRKRASPQKVVARSTCSPLNVAWYGGGRRNVEVVTGTAHWYKAGTPLAPVRWVFVRDRTGTHRDDYFYSTDVDLTPTQIIEAFTGRWSIETTFQEARAYLGLETTRGRKHTTVLRAAPCLFGLYSFIALLFAHLPKRYTAQLTVRWAGKQETAFSDAITAVRRWLWIEWVFANPRERVAFSKFSPTVRNALLYAVAQAA